MTGTNTSRIGRYRILERIGAGGQAEIFRAERIEPPNIVVALKVLHTGMSSDVARRRFEREIELQGSLDHPFIPRLIDHGDAMRPWLALEYLDGATPIDRLCARLRPSLRARLELMSATCHAVQHAHDRGVLHLDIKPENVLVVEEHGELTPRLVDFGISRSGAPSVPPPCSSQATAGSIGFQSPEQSMGDPDLDTRTDVFALGRILEEIVVPCFRTAHTPDELPPCERLRWVWEKATDPDRGARYGSARELADDLRRFMQGLPLKAAPPSLLYELACALRRHRRAVLFLAVILSSLATAWALVWNEARAAQRAADEAVRWAGEARREVQDLENRAVARLTIGLRERASRMWPLSAAQLVPLDQWLADARDVARRLPELKGSELPHDWLEDLRRFVSPPSSTLLGPSLVGTSLLEVEWRTERLREAQRIAQDHAAEFRAADIAPRSGLLPLRRDPDSGLHEFLHVLTGDPPEVSSDGSYLLGPRTGVIFVLIPASPSQPPLLISKYEITQAQWWRLSGSSPSQYAPIESIVSGWTHPVEMVSWNECVTYLTRVGLELPTAEEWVRAAGAGHADGWCTGTDPRDLIAFANVRDETAHQRSTNKALPHAPWSDGWSAHAPVGTFQPNAFGLHDVHGNVAEWCADRVPSDLGKTPPLRKALFMGGSWYRDAEAARLEVRDRVSIDTHWSCVGLRPVIRLDK